MVSIYEFRHSLTFIQKPDQITPTSASGCVSQWSGLPIKCKKIVTTVKCLSIYEDEF